MLYGIFQFEYVAGPFVEHQRGHGSLGYPCNVLSGQMIKVLNETICQKGDVSFPLRAS